MGVEFKLGRNDHKKVEDFLARRPSGVTAITIDAHRARYQAGAVEVARAGGIDVLVEPLTERLADPGFEPDGLPYATGEPIHLDQLHRDQSACEVLVEQVVQVQTDLATTITPPHFLVSDRRSAQLNLRLARLTVHLADGLRVRPVLVVKRRFAIDTATWLAENYSDLGVDAIELRVTPVGGGDESVHKIRSVFNLADVFGNAGLEVVLGCSGNIGQTAVALGHATSFSVGIGMRERVDHAETISRQMQPVDEDEPRFGAQCGVYLAAPAVTVGRQVARALLGNGEIRTRIGCRLESCAYDIAGPTADPRDHYLHARAHDVAQLLSRPPSWRPMMEQDRLRRALDLRGVINAAHLPANAYPLKTRTARSLLENIEHEERLSA